MNGLSCFWRPPTQNNNSHLRRPHLLAGRCMHALLQRAPVAAPLSSGQRARLPSTDSPKVLSMRRRQQVLLLMLAALSISGSNDAPAAGEAPEDQVHRLHRRGTGPPGLYSFAPVGKAMLDWLYREVRAAAVSILGGIGARSPRD